MLNGDSTAKSADALNFTIFGQPGAALSSAPCQPLGAPVAGGTRVVVHGEGFLDLGDARLRFGRLGAVQAEVSADGRNVTAGVAAHVGGRRRRVARLLGRRRGLHAAARALRPLRRRRRRRHRPLAAGGPIDGGTRVTLLGRGFGSYPAACLFGDASVEASVRDDGAAVCEAPARPDGPADVALELSLNGETSALRRTASGVPFTYYRRAGDRYAQGAAEVRIASMTPLGGPAAGGTVVTVRGAGFVDRGGVYCRFGRRGGGQASGGGRRAARCGVGGADCRGDGGV